MSSLPGLAGFIASYLATGQVARRSPFRPLSIDKSGSYNERYPMAIETRVRKIGNSLGIVLPKEALQSLRVEEGSTLYLTEAPNCSLSITPDRPGFDEKMMKAERLMRRYRNAFRELAK